MEIVPATKIEIQTRMPPRTEGMTMPVIGTSSRAGFDGETMTWREEGFTLEFAADIARHGEAHIVLEVDMRLSISAS